MIQVRDRLPDRAFHDQRDIDDIPRCIGQMHSPDLDTANDHQAPDQHKAGAADGACWRKEIPDCRPGRPVRVIRSRTHKLFELRENHMEPMSEHGNVMGWRWTRQDGGGSSADYGGGILRMPDRCRECRRIDAGGEH